MKGTVQVYEKEFEYDFLCGWIKYNRIQRNISQEALCHGICSVSHLSYFENGKKTLRGEIIEALLKKLGITSIVEVEDIGLMRQRFYNMMLQVDSFDYEAARVIYRQLKSMEHIISCSPYNMEYKIYDLMFRFFVDEKSYSDLSRDVLALDKIYITFNSDLQYLYLLVTGKLIYDHLDHKKGIERLIASHNLKDTPWINYRLGVAYCLNDEPLKALYYLEIALENYSKSGRYMNALQCHDFLGMCYTALSIYDKAEEHYRAMLTGAEHFKMNRLTSIAYTDLAQLHISKKEYRESLNWSLKALHISGEPLLPASSVVIAYHELQLFDECKKIFEQYLTSVYKNSRYYNLLYFHYLSIFYFQEDIFYREVTEKIIPFYEKINYIIIYKPMKLRLAEHLEGKRKYKEANIIYKELLGS